METIEHTLQELEHKAKQTGSLADIYIKDFYPNFRELNKKFSIDDLDQYHNYNLQNITDDLRHLQKLIADSPKNKKFQEKKKFLLCMIDKTIAGKQKAEKQTKRIQSPKRKQVKGMSERALIKTQPQSEKQNKSLNLNTQLKKKESLKKPANVKVQEISLNLPLNSNNNNNEKYHKLMGSQKNSDSQAGSMNDLDEDKSGMGSSGKSNNKNEFSVGGFLTGVEVTDKVTPRTELQENVNQVLKKLGVGKQVWKDYVQSKNIHELAGMGIGIEPTHRKVDEALELKKFETEYERYNTRKNQMFRSMDLKTTKLIFNEEFDGKHFQTHDNPRKNYKRRLSSKQFIPDNISSINDLNNLNNSMTTVSGWLPSINNVNNPSIILKEEDSNATIMSRQKSREQPLQENNERDTSIHMPNPNISFSANTDNHIQGVTLPSIDSRPSSRERVIIRTHPKIPTLRANHPFNDPNLVTNSSSNTPSPEFGIRTKKYINNGSPTQNNNNVFQAPQPPTRPSSQGGIGFSHSNSNVKFVQVENTNQVKLFNTNQSNRPTTASPQISFGKPPVGRNGPIRAFKFDESHIKEVETENNPNASNVSTGDNTSQANNNVSSNKTSIHKSQDMKKPLRMSDFHTVDSEYIQSQKNSQIGSNSNSVTCVDNIVSRGQQDSIVEQGSLTNKSSWVEDRTIESNYLPGKTTYKSISYGTNSSSDIREESGYSNKYSSMFKSIAELEYKGHVKRQCMLGGGSEARVYLCKLKDFDDLVALKQYDLIIDENNNNATYQSLKKEFKMLRQLHHDQVIQYFSIYRPKRMSCENCIEFGFLMEYMSGGSLEQYIADEYQNITHQNKKKIMKQILLGLNYLHENKIIHRDLKPANILLSNDKQLVKITDFGISIKTNNDSSAKRTLVGTPWYMAPEVINQEAYSSKADIWSVACCFFHLATGKKPYHNSNAIQALMMMVSNKSPLDLCDEEQIQEIEAFDGLKEFLAQCFNKTTGERPTASELLEHKLFDGVEI